jgi:hypothetical protein
MAAARARELGRKQFERVDVELAGDAFDGLEGQVALTPLDPAHVGPMHPKNLSERLLAEAALLPVCAQVPTDDAL